MADLHLVLDQHKLAMNKAMSLQSSDTNQTGLFEVRKMMSQMHKITASAKVSLIEHLINFKITASFQLQSRSQRYMLLLI